MDTKLALKTAGKASVDWAIRNKGILLPVGSIGCSWGATILAIRNSRDIMNTLDDAHDILKNEQDKETRKKIYKDVIKAIAPKLIPILALEVTSTALTIVYKKESDKKVAELTTALNLAQNAITQYKLWENEAKKELGEEKVKEINQEVTQDIVTANPPTKENSLGAPTDQKRIEGPAVQTMWCWYDSNTPERYLWSRKSPVDIERWVLEQNALFANHKQEGNKLSINAFYEFLSEGIGATYTVNGLYGNPDYYWRYTTEDIHSDFPEVVNIDTYTVEGPDGRPVNAFHCNFFPY